MHEDEQLQSLQHPHAKASPTVTQPDVTSANHSTIDPSTALHRAQVLNDTLHAVTALDPSPAAAPVTNGLLAGIPLLIKDNIEMEGLPATAGSRVLADHHLPSHDAPAVAALRSAGAALLGKANLSEWANFRSTRSTSGWSALGGLTANPYALDRSAGGSSSGSAAAVAAGIVPGALGTETDGSILCPASLCGCVGLKPTLGSVSAEGVVPIAQSQDVVGPIAASVLLAAAIFDVLASQHTLDALTRGVRGLRIGVPRQLGWGRRNEIDILCEQVLSFLANEGAAIIEDSSSLPPENLDEVEMTLLLSEFHHGIDAYLGKHADSELTSLSDLIALHQSSSEETAHFGLELFEMALNAPPAGSEAHTAALQQLRTAGRENGIDSMLASDTCDAPIIPSFDPAWKSDLVNGDPAGLYSPSQLPAVSGYPAITVPVGLVHGLPAGILIMGTAHSEETLLRIAATIEAGRDPLPPPAFRAPSAG